MTRVGLLAAPPFFAVRRSSARRLAFATLVASLSAARGLIALASRTARIVGLGRLRAGLVTDPTALGSGALLVSKLAPPLAPLVRNVGSSVVTSAELEPGAVHGFAVAPLARRLRVAIVRVERGDQL